ncbi:FtsB family cell division protein [Nonomuraea sp. NPDC003214]
MAKRPQLTGRAAILAIVVCAIAMSLAYPVREYIAQRRNIAELREEKARVEAERQRLLAEAQQVRDPNWIKRTAKERLHYCGPGEKCYVVMGADPGKGTTAVKRPAAPPPWYQTLWESVQAADDGTGRRAGVTDPADTTGETDTSGKAGKTGETDTTGEADKTGEAGTAGEGE